MLPKQLKDSQRHQRQPKQVELFLQSRDQKRMMVENACWEGLVTWWAVEGLEHVVGGVKVVVVVVIGCVVVLLVALSIVDT